MSGHVNTRVCRRLCNMQSQTFVHIAGCESPYCNITCACSLQIKKNVCNNAMNDDYEGPFALKLKDSVNLNVREQPTSLEISSTKWRPPWR